MTYINSIGEISPQGNMEDGHFVCVDPVYSEIIHPLQLRRKSRILKMGMGASGICINRLPEAAIDAIIVGTGLACNADLEKFHYLIFDGNEQSLPPTPFINSSNNSVAAQIAMMHQITGYNNTFCHRGAAFEAALTDAVMLLGEGEAQHVLAGGIDEYSPQYHSMLNEVHEKKNTVPAGEGAVFFILEKEQRENTFAGLKGVHSFLELNDSDAQFIKTEISVFLQRHSLDMADIDVFVSGRNGNTIADAIYNELEADCFPHTEKVDFKHLCGEYMTSTAFALARAARHLKGQKNRSALIYNHYRHYHYINHSLVLLETVS
jgi:hypothetical protein